jgi:hypothetical protein
MELCKSYPAPMLLGGREDKKFSVLLKHQIGNKKDPAVEVFSGLTLFNSLCSL